MAIESLAQQSSAFANSLRIDPTPVDKTADENAKEAKTPAQGDSVTLSEEARALAAAEKQDEAAGAGGEGAAGASGKSDKESEADQIIAMIKEQIKKVKEEIEKLEEADMPGKIKEKMIQAKQSELLALNEQLMDAMEKKFKALGQNMSGGTRAEGFGNSVATF